MSNGTKLDLYVSGELVERLYMEPGDSFEAEVHTDDFEIRVPEDDIDA